MFDRTTFATEVRQVTERVTEHVHEHRAPTDESVRLLAEMEAKARDKIIEAVHIGDTTFQCVVHMERDFASDDVRLMAVFSLNGKRMTAEHTAKPITGYDKPAAFTALRDAIALKIATEVMSVALKNLRL